MHAHDAKQQQQLILYVVPCRAPYSSRKQEQYDELLRSSSIKLHTTPPQELDKTIAVSALGGNN